MPAIPAQGSGTKFKFCTRNQARPRKVSAPSPPSSFPCWVKGPSICWLPQPQGNRGLHVPPYITHGTRHQGLQTEPLEHTAFCCISLHQGLFCKASPSATVRNGSCQRTQALYKNKQQRDTPRSSFCDHVHSPGQKSLGSAPDTQKASLTCPLASSRSLPLSNFCSRWFLLAALCNSRGPINHS